MSKHVKAPGLYNVFEKWVFLAGTIDNGKSIDWQTETAEWIIKNTDYGVLNPRRESWDASWVQSISNPEFAEQVNWELTGLANASKVIFYIKGDSLSPISLLELGMCAARVKCNTYVCCEKDYWRRGNVEVVCERFHIPLYDNLQELLESIW